MMDRPAPSPMIRLADYQPPDWLIPEVSLRLELDSDCTLVHARLLVRRNGAHDRPLTLDGDTLETRSVLLNGAAQPLPNRADLLTLAISGDEAVVETIVAVRPSANSRLMGLYASGGNLITQCEAEGFRRITWFSDRPDVLSVYHVRMEASRADFPILLGNGDRIMAGGLPDDRHFAEWHDPHPKPCYLFALVAGQLAALEDRFVTRSGREVRLAIWTAEKDVPRCRHAMDSLRQAMAWDEEHYGREYDLDMFNIVAVHDFNFGAMENKGLNIFNAKYILADADTATDFDFDGIAAVVAHEYFHNWSGNRVTCRDWFQLSLKEGFTVFRDQQFSESIGSATVKRIEAIRSLRAFQFPEDDGPLAHPVRPDAYLEISNFYTATIYNKGAELIRMMHRLLGPERFRDGADRYFLANDGRAATIEDFLAAMELAGLDATRFRHWYSQAGTPLLEVAQERDSASGQLVVRLAQTNPKAPACAQPLPIPLDLALFGADGAMLASRTAVMGDERMELRFEGIATTPIISANRGFAAPIIVKPEPTRAELALLSRAETDFFARYEAMQQLMLSALLESVAQGQSEGADDVAAAMAPLLDGWEEDPALVAETILVPAESLIGDRMDLLDPQAVHRAREELRRALLDQLGDRLWAVFHAVVDDAASLAPRDKGLRRLRGVVLSLLMARDDHAATAAAFLQYCNAATMTDRMAALTALSHSMAVERDEALAMFHRQYATVPEVVDKWFAVQASSVRPDTLSHVLALQEHPQFDPRNPNRLRALILGFAMNQPRFHRSDGAGYDLLARQLQETDRINPQSAARLAVPLTRWRRLVAPYATGMQDALKRVAATPGLSKDLSEVVGQSLKE